MRLTQCSGNLAFGQLRGSFVACCLLGKECLRKCTFVHSDLQDPANRSSQGVSLRIPKWRSSRTNLRLYFLLHWNSHGCRIVGRADFHVSRPKDHASNLLMLERMPLSGGQYHWVSILAPANSAKFLSYITGKLPLGQKKAI